jgi:hypothetical protein
MDTALRSSTKPPVRTVVAFIGIFLALYSVTFAIAELAGVRNGTETAFQRLLAARGKRIDWVVLGASHALPLRFGDVPARLANDSGQSMMVLAEIGAGPLYNRFVFEQALEDLEVTNLLYVIDSFAFDAEDWNEARLADRKLLSQTPLRLPTARIMAALALEHDVDPRSLLDYLTGFSKLNPVERFPQEGWRGEQDFDRSFRPSRHAVSSRISYLYPTGAPATATVDRYLDILGELFDRAAAAGVDVMVIKPPLTDAFYQALPNEAAFDSRLEERLVSRGIPYHDLSEKIGNPEFYFDTDHLNRQGIDALYRDHLRALLSPE